MAVSIDHENSEIAVVNTSKPPAATWRARFVGQGYKQVIFGMKHSKTIK